MKKEEIRYDPIRENIVKGVNYINDNNLIIVKILTIIILTVGVISYYNYMGSKKSESASHLAGRAQNIFINGNIDEAMVKFNRVLTDYPKTTGAVQSLVYLLGDAMRNNNLDDISRILSNNVNSSNDPVVLSAISKFRGDVSLVNKEFSDALKYYKEAQSSASVNVIKYELDIATTFIAKKNYIDAVRILEKIINNVKIGFSEKNIAEELMAYAKQKMNL